VQCKGFLFDLDGTLVDSLPVVERSWCKWADRFAIDHDEILSFIHGKQAITSFAILCRVAARRISRPNSAARADRSH
jgi:beta-phosphoglucomutase-like phosphatase (HAD superfamily)